MANTVNDMFDEMLEQTVDQMETEEVTEETEKARVTVKESLSNFLGYIKSKRFTNKCKDISKKHNVNYKVIKNHFIGRLLGRIADVLHLGVAITAEIINYAVEFLAAIIKKTAEFTQNICVSLINLLTLNCGGAC